MAVRTFGSTLELVSNGSLAFQADRGTLIDLQERSVPWSSVSLVSGKLGISWVDLLSVIGMSGRTSLRRQKEGYLKPDEADRLLRVARVFEEATRVFGTEDKAGRWLRDRSVVLSDLTPLSLLDCDAGTQAVIDELTRIDFGDFA